MAGSLGLWIMTIAGVASTLVHVVGWIALIGVGFVVREPRSRWILIGAACLAIVNEVARAAAYPLVSSFALDVGIEVFQMAMAGITTLSTLVWLVSWALVLFAVFRLARAHQRAVESQAP